MIDIQPDPRGAREERVRLKCLSARFVIDISMNANSRAVMERRLKCLSARFVIDIPDTGRHVPHHDARVSNAFRLDS